LASELSESRTPATTDQGGPSRGVTGRAVFIALLLIPPNAYWITQMAVVRYEGHPTTVSLFYNTVFILLVLIGLNAVLHRWLPRIALHRNELLVIYLMLCLASSLCSHDMIQVQAPEISYPYHFATPENKWEDLFFKYLPEHLIISDPAILDPAFDGGTTLYTAQRLLAWGRPALWWTAFLAVLCGMMLCLNALLRRRWMEREKLTYPITHLPLEMTEARTPLWHSRLLWIGFGVAGAIDLLNGLHELYPAVPLIKVRVVHFDAYMNSLFVGAPWVALRGTRISFYPFAVGLGLLLPTDLLFSCWFFYLFWRAQRLVAFMLGWNQIPGFPFVEEQSSAAYLGLCLFALYTGRQHWRAIWDHLWGARRLDDRGEPLPTSGAVIGLFAGVLFLFAFSAKVGLSPWVTPLFFGLYFMLSLAVTRIRAELGPPAHDLHRGGPDWILVNLFGTRPSPLGPRNLMGLSVYFWFNRAYRGHPMPHQLEGFKIAEVTGVSMSRLSGAFVLVSVVGALAAYWAQVHSYYSYGMSAKMSFVAQVFGREPYQRLQSWLTVAHGPDYWALGAYAVGMAFTLVLMALRMRFVWWPFHPVGYAISSSWSMNCLWMPLLIAWIAKVVVTRYSSSNVFRSLIPLALGLILGEFVIGSLWCLLGIALQINTYSFWV